MATKRTPRARNLIPEIRPEELHFLSDGLLGAAPAENDLRLFLLKGDEKAVKKLWAEHRECILSEWIKAHPGTRPSLWWRYSAPQITAESIALLGRGANVAKLHREDFCEPRLRLGGTGDPCHEVLNFWPAFDRGLPDTGWVTEWQCDYYNGRAVDVDGNRIGTEYNEGHFAGAPIDPKDPPVYESEAAYLKRHGLFEPGEQKRLTPKDFKPEVVLPDAEDETVQ